MDAGANVEFRCWESKNALINTWKSRASLQRHFRQVAAVTPTTLNDEDSAVARAIHEKFSNINYKEAMSVESERTLEEKWLPAVEVPLKALQLRIIKDKTDLKLPVEFCVGFSKPNPNLIAYMSSRAVNHAFSSFDYALPVTTIGNKGGPKSTTIDAALPQDACTLHAMVYAWAAFGMPLDEICVVSAHTEHGIVTQFYVSFLSDEHEVVPFTPAVTPATLHTAGDTGSSSSVGVPPIPVAQAQQKVKEGEKEKDEQTRGRHMIMLPLSKKLDPMDPEDRNVLARMYGVMLNHVAEVVAWFSAKDKDKELWCLQAGAGPKDEGGEWNEEFEADLLRSDTLSEEDEVVEAAMEASYAVMEEGPGAGVVV
ncbi:hypothetical protein HK097_000870 [Rhizophlyctis rosea]|uniref:Uncharacterized protein n=1 Tax=Rhizophlyctis rosea TaxID=64517 RepID=A0AAD5S6T8_9FUNG|nr:hypothetical protein HK097_000870 [Rhizophlyctis rosea]